MDIKQAVKYLVECNINLNYLNQTFGGKREKALNKPSLKQMNLSFHSFDVHNGFKDKERYVRSIRRQNQPSSFNRYG